jgi:hypothetical protein
VASVYPPGCGSGGVDDWGGDTVGAARAEVVGGGLAGWSQPSTLVERGRLQWRLQ